MSRIRIAAVSYINTWPFLEGMKMTGIADEVELLLHPPSVCAKLFQRGEVDIALSPVAALPGAGQHQVITNFGIGCDDFVRTVALMSQYELPEIRNVQLDTDSRTSNQLIKILAREHWGVNWTFFHHHDENEWLNRTHCARVAIGDKVFALEDKIENAYDLGHAWKQMTGLPFVFAVWVGRDSVSSEFVSRLNESFERGIASIPNMKVENEHQRNYLRENISYRLDAPKIEALELFLEKINYPLIRQHLKI